MVIHKLIATCDCNNENCIGHGDGAIVNITLSASDEMDIEFLTKLLGTIEACAIRVGNTVIKAEHLPLIRAAIEDVYKIPEISQKIVEDIFGGEAASQAEPFDNLDELELKEVG